jgi:hypothetical protein
VERIKPPNTPSIYDRKDTRLSGRWFNLNDWLSAILQLYQALKIAVQAVKLPGKIRKIMRKEYTVIEIRERLQSGELHFGDKITLLGTFSEYIPFVDPKFILKEAESLPKTLPRTARMKPIDNMYCGAVFPLDQEDAFAREVLPIFYSIDSRMIEHSTGQMLEMECKITQVPMAYTEVINQNEYFTFEKEEGLTIPFGLEVTNVELYGLIDSFKVNSWLIGTLDPAPRFKGVEGKHVCGNCKKLFSYMAIDPVNLPIGYGCAGYSNPETNVPAHLKKLTEEFVRLEEEAIPYLVFPDPFRLFELFYPKVDILSDSQRNHSKNILLGAVEQNIEMLFEQPGVFQEDVEIPQKMAISIDFQYDQLRKITRQTFDPAKVPVWICPHYEPSHERRSRK